MWIFSGFRLGRISRYSSPSIEDLGRTDVERRCKHCGEPFIPRENVARQRYCTKAGCQQARRNQWRKRKLLTDRDYRDNQSDAQKRWRESHKEYWGEYRASHPDYVEKNRALQRERNRRGRGALIAKGDELSVLNPMRSGYYRLIPAGGDAIAKRDEYLVKLDILPGTYPQGPTPVPDCKQIT
jgi:hypothetical protein